jgi:pilus assembly protein CpaC
MYDNHLARTHAARRTALVSVIATSLLTAWGSAAIEARAQDFDSGSLVRKISGLSEKLELTTNTSRILTLDKNIPRVQVNNPELLAVTPLSATQIQISAKKAGVTQVNLWDEEGNIHTVDVMVYGDSRELSAALQTQFPHSSIKVYRYSESLVLTGFVDRPDHVGPIMRLAEDYAPKVINNINVGGVQQILLKVKVMEVNRTKLRRAGVDWSYFASSGVGTVSSVSGLISEVSQLTRSADAITPNVEGGPGVVNNLGSFQFGIIDGRDVFFGFLDFLQQRDIAKTLAEPNLVAVSGRPAQFNVGGEVPILIPQSLGTTSIEFKPF